MRSGCTILLLMLISQLFFGGGGGGASMEKITIKFLTTSINFTKAFYIKKALLEIFVLKRHIFSWIFILSLKHLYFYLKLNSECTILIWNPKFKISRSSPPENHLREGVIHSPTLPLSVHRASEKPSASLVTCLNPPPRNGGSGSALKVVKSAWVSVQLRFPLLSWNVLTYLADRSIIWFLWTLRLRHVL